MRNLLSLGIVACALGCSSSPTPLAPLHEGTVGVPHHGVLTKSDELPTHGSGYRRFREQGTAYFGVPRLVRAIEEVAQSMHEADPTAPLLVVGDLSARGGGKVPRHNSHRTGRDVDFLFFVTTPEGIPLENPGFFPLDGDGFVRVPDGRYLQLDTRRQWLFIKSLLSNESIDIQFLFMSKLLEARILDYALRVEDDFELLYRAQAVMQQPGDSLPHADHIHMRIACRPEEMLSGCMGGGPHWPWFARPPELDQPDRQLFAELRDSDPFVLPPSPPGAPPVEGSLGLLGALPGSSMQQPSRREAATPTKDEPPAPLPAEASEEASQAEVMSD